MNKASLFVLGGLILIFLLSLNTGCKKDDPAVTEFIIQVDSILHEDTIVAGSSTQFIIEFYGEVGENDCYEFLRFDNAFGADFMEITLVGQYTARDNCNPGIVYMNPVAAGYTGLTPGTWTIKVMQPDGQAALESTVVVE